MTRNSFLEHDACIFNTCRVANGLCLYLGFTHPEQLKGANIDRMAPDNSGQQLSGNWYATMVRAIDVINAKNKTNSEGSGTVSSNYSTYLSTYSVKYVL